MARRALTLLELLLALSLLLALGAIALPVAMDSLRERTFEASSDILRNQLLLARAHAGASGRPVEVLYEAGPPRVVARYFRAEMPQEMPQEQRDERKRAPRRAEERNLVPFSAAENGTRFPQDAIVEGWAENPLPLGLWIAGEPPGNAGAPQAAAAAEPEPRPLRLALFMPEGSALLCRRVWIGDEHGRQAKLVINPWTGLASIERLPAGGEPQEGDKP